MISYQYTKYVGIRCYKQKIFISVEQSIYPQKQIQKIILAVNDFYIVNHHCQMHKSIYRLLYL